MMAKWGPYETDELDPVVPGAPAHRPEPPMSDERLDEIEVRVSSMFDHAHDLALTVLDQRREGDAWFEKRSATSGFRALLRAFSDAFDVETARKDVPDLFAEVRRLKRALQLSEASRGRPVPRGLQRMPHMPQPWGQAAEDIENLRRIVGQD